jgi:hypothetical protein
MNPRKIRNLLATSAIAAAALGAGATGAQAETFVTVSDGGTITEGSGGIGGVATFVVNVRHERVYSAYNWSLAPGAGTASQPADHAPIEGGGAGPGGNCTLKVGCDLPPVTVSLPIAADDLDEPDETIIAKLAGNGIVVKKAEGLTTITDDDAAPTLRIDGGTLLEGNAGTRFLASDVQLSAPSGRDVTVNYATAAGTATVGSDFDGRSGALTIPAGQTKVAFDVPVHGDTQREPDEDFRTLLSAPVNATIADGDATVTIRNDDDVPTPPALPTDLIVRNEPIAPPAGATPGAPQQSLVAGATADELAWPVALSFKGMTSGPRVKVRCDTREETCQGRVLVRLGGKTLKTQRFTLDGGESRTITLKMTRKQRRKLRRAGEVSFKVIATDAAGNRTQTSRGFDL